MGKSRLAETLIEQARQSDMLIAVGHCTPVSGGELPFGPFVEMLSQIAAAPDWRSRRHDVGAVARRVDRFGAVFRCPLAGRRPGAVSAVHERALGLAPPRRAPAGDARGGGHPLGRLVQPRPAQLPGPHRRAGTTPPRAHVPGRRSRPGPEHAQGDRRAEPCRDESRHPSETAHRGPGQRAARHVGRPAARRRNTTRWSTCAMATRSSHSSWRPTMRSRAPTPRPCVTHSWARRRAAGRCAVRTARGRGTRAVHPTRGLGELHRKHGGNVAANLRLLTERGLLIAGAERYDFRHAIVRESVVREMLPSEQRLHTGPLCKGFGSRAGTGRRRPRPARPPPRRGQRVLGALPVVLSAAGHARGVYAFAEARRQLSVAREVLWSRVDNPEEISRTVLPRPALSRGRDGTLGRAPISRGGAHPQGHSDGSASGT